MTDDVSRTNGGESVENDMKADVESVSSRVQELEAENEQLRERLNEIEQSLSVRDAGEPTAHPASSAEESTADDDSGPGESGASTATRRGMLGAFAALGLLGATGSASAASGSHLGESWSGDPSGPGLQVDTVDTALKGTSSAGSGLGIALWGESSSESGRAVYGKAASTTGSNYGVYGRTESEEGSGVYGYAVATSGLNFGVRGYSDSTSGRGVYGKASASSGNTYGLYGRAESPDGTALYGKNGATSGSALGLSGSTDSTEGIAVLGIASADSGTNYGIEGRTNSVDGFGLYTPDDAKIDGTIEVGGDLQVSGQKNFVQTVSTSSGPKEVAYTAVEAGEIRTETSGIAEMTDDVAIVGLPEHFALVTSSDKELVVQITPYADREVSPQITDRSTDQIVVKDPSEETSSYTFAYTVKGIREGFEDQETVREKS